MNQKHRKSYEKKRDGQEKRVGEEGKKWRGRRRKGETKREGENEGGTRICEFIKTF